MIFAFHYNTCARNGVAIMDAFYKSLPDSFKKITTTHPIKCDAAVIWSVLFNKPIRKTLWDFYQREKIPIIVLEVGGLIRNYTWRVGINGIINGAYFGDNNYDPFRPQKLGVNLKPYKNVKDGKILICCQNEQSLNWRWGSTETWCNAIISKLKNVTDRKIVIRQHPRFIVKNAQEKPIYSNGYDNFDLPESLNSTLLTINMNSNAAIESLLNGVPVSVDSSSLCYELSTAFKDINQPKELDRTKWLVKMSHCEWTEDEIKNGTLWDRLKTYWA